MDSFDRRLLKENAKIAMRNNFWVAFAVVVVGIILGFNWSGITRTGGSVGFSSSFHLGSTSDKEFLEAFQSGMESGGGLDIDYSYNDTLSDEENLKNFYDAILDSFGITSEKFVDILVITLLVMSVIVIFISVLITVIQFLLGSFVSAPTGVGVRNFFMKNRMNKATFSDMFFAFRNGRYMKTVKTMFSINIRMFGWSLLFYFPGVVKYYQYYFVPFIMAENPDITPKRARELSKQMSDGHKWQMFVLELSFLGWAILAVLLILTLGLISCGLLMIPALLFLCPLVVYEYATFAELYMERREYALMTGMSNANELIGF